MNKQLQTLATGLAWPESPRWHGGYLWFSDVHNFCLKKVCPGEAVQMVARVPGRPAGLGFMPDGRLLLASALDKKLWWVSTDGELELALDLSEHVKGLLNDMVVDKTGRAWVGDTGFDLLKGEPEVAGTLLSWAPGSSVVRSAEGVLFPNGIAINPENDTLYLAETFGSRISAFSMKDHGELVNRRIHATLEGKPDGLCLDASGALWVPLLWQQEFHRITQQGEISHRIELSNERAISCVLGGPDRNQLFMGVCQMDDSDKKNIKRFGSIKYFEVLEVGAGTP